MLLCPLTILSGVSIETGQRRGVGLLEVNEKKLRKEVTEARRRLTAIHSICCISSLLVAVYAGSMIQSQKISLRKLLLN